MQVSVALQQLAHRPESRDLLTPIDHPVGVDRVADTAIPVRAVWRAERPAVALLIEAFLGTFDLSTRGAFGFAEDRKQGREFIRGRAFDPQQQRLTQRRRGARGLPYPALELLDP